MHGGVLYSLEEPTMSEGKNVSISFRVSARFKALLEAAAARERRSQTNTLEILLFQYWSRDTAMNAWTPPLR